MSIPAFGVIEIDRGGIISNDSGDFSVGEIAVENNERSLASDSLNDDTCIGWSTWLNDLQPPHGHSGF